jgi:predicted metalloprotease with PDZ domain
LQPGDTVRLTLFRRDDLREIEVVAAGRPRGKWKLARVAEASDAQRAAYESWLKQPWPAKTEKTDEAKEDAEEQP